MKNILTKENNLTEKYKNYRYYRYYIEMTTIAISVEVKERMKEFGKMGGIIQM